MMASGVRHIRSSTGRRLLYSFFGFGMRNQKVSEVRTLVPWMIGGCTIMAIISFDVRKNKELQRVELIGNYWHFVDLVWIFLFPLLYIAK